MHAQTFTATRRLVIPQAWISVYAPAAIAVALRLASGPTATASYLALALYALCGLAHRISALALSWLFTMIDPVPGKRVDGAICPILYRRSLRDDSLRLLPPTFKTAPLATVAKRTPRMPGQPLDFARRLTTAYICAGGGSCNTRLG